MRKILKPDGFSMIESLIAMATLSLFAVTALALIPQWASIRRYVSSSRTGIEIKNNVLQSLNSGAAWRLTVLANPNMACLSTLTLPNGDCVSVSGAPNPIVVKDAAGMILSDPTFSGDRYGLDLDGKPCQGFDSVNGNDICPFQVKVAWQPVCTTSPCTNPQVRLTTEFLYSPTTAVSTTALNSLNYKLDFVRPNTQFSAQESCSSLGGVFTAGNCVLGMAGQCPYGAVLGVDANNNKICGFPFTFNCPPGSVFVGADATGRPKCSCLGSCAGYAAPFNWRDSPAYVADPFTATNLYYDSFAGSGYGSADGNGANCSGSPDGAYTDGGSDGGDGCDGNGGGGGCGS